MTATRTRVGLAIVVAIVVVGVGALVFTRIARDDGPACAQLSADEQATSDLSGWFALLRCHDHPLSSAETLADIDEPTTIFVSNAPALTDAAFADLLRVTREGSTVIIVGTDDRLPDQPGPLDLQSNSDVPARFEPGDRSPLTTDVTEVEMIGGAVYTNVGSATPLLLDDDDNVLLADAGLDGRVVFLSDTSLFNNQQLIEADNALFALRLAGPEGQPVTFLRITSGDGSGGGGSGGGGSGGGGNSGGDGPPPPEENTGLSALPFEWKFALVGLAVAAIVFALARGRRVGPPNDVDRALPPRRAAYVDALGASLAHSNDPAGAGASMRSHARARVIAIAGLGADASDDDIQRAGTEIGLTAQEAAALRSDARSEHDLILTARVVTRLNAATAKETPQ